MIKRVLFFVLLLLISICGQSNFSTRTKLLINSVNTDLIARNKISEKNKSQFGIRNNHVNALIKTNSEFNPVVVKNYGIRLHAISNNIYSASLPINNLNFLSSVKGIEFVSIDSPIKKKLDVALTETKTKLVHSGFEIPQGITGEGTIVGIVDIGFDYTHPIFYKDADNLRIARVWDHNDETGTHPSEFNYGSELTTSEEIKLKGRSFSAEYESHGTHVAGIAAGSGYLSDGKYIGAAPGAEFVLVEVGYGESNVLDAVAYIFAYAESVGKPAVVNMSLGTHIGPHDGTSLIDQAFDALQTNGRILVGAAGNEGSDNIHLIKLPEEDSIKTVLQMLQSGFYPGYITGDFNIWGEKDTPFSIRFAVIDTSTYEVINESDLFISENSSIETLLIMEENDTLAVIEASADNGEFSGKHNMYINARAKDNLYFSFTLIGPGTLHAWDLSEFGFSDIGLPEVFKDGDSNYTVGEIGGTGRNVISVGAYTTKNSFVNIEGFEMEIPYFAEVGSYAPFTSLGPTVDGRTKPNISAPGNVVASAVSSFDIQFEDPIYQQFLVDQTSLGDQDWFYAAFQGTSMSSPLVAGIIALMLQANPQLNAQQINTIFQSTGREDEFTGDLPNNGSNLWGYGKIDALSAVKSAMNLTAVDDKLNPSFYLANNYPNPFNPNTIIEYSIGKEDFVSLKIFDVLGREVKELVSEVQSAGHYRIIFDGSDLSTGIYLYQIKAGKFSELKKMILLK